MNIVGTFLVILLILGGFGIMQAIFYLHTGRGVWRAMVPTAFRFTILPNDEVRLDSFAVLEEWTALLLATAFAILPLIALHVLGFIRVFSY